MPTQRQSAIGRISAVVALLFVIGGCTPGGQFDPTTLFDKDMFETKKKLQGQREPVFPNGVPGAETGVPPDLVKGYQPPPEQDTGGTTADQADNGTAAKSATQTAAPVEPKPKPKPKLASAPPRRIDVGLSPKPAVSAQPGTANSTAWPAPPQAAPAQQTAAPSQSVWPAPPQTAPARQAAQPAQSIWPNPPASGTATQ